MKKYPVHDDDALQLILDMVDRFADRHIPINELRRRDRDHVPPFDLMPVLGAAGDGMRILASAGYASESDMQRIWGDARLYTFGESTNDIQRDIIAKELGL